MPAEGDLIAIRMRLLGGKQAAAEADAVTASIRETGAAAKATAAEQTAAAKSAQKATAASTLAAKKQVAATKAVGKSLTRYVTTPVLAIGAASIYMAAKFDRAMLQLHTQAGVATSELGGLRDRFMEIAKLTGFAPEEIAGAGYRLAGAGLRGRKLEQATEASAKLAMVGNADPEETAKTLSQIWFTNIKGGKDFNRVVAELNATVGAGDLRLPQLVDALGTGVVASAKEAGLSMQDVNGALAVFGDETNNVSGWAAQLATAFHFFTSPGDKASKAMEKLGLESHQLSADLAKPKGLVTAIKDLKEHLEALPGGIEGVQAKDILGEILPGGRGRVMLVLMNQLDRLESKMVQIKGTSDEFKKSVQETEDQPMVRMKKAWAEVEVTMIKLGEALIPVVVPALEKAGEAVGDLADFFNGLSDPLKAAIGEAIGLAAALGPLILLGGKLEKMWASMKALSTMGAIGSGGPMNLGGRLGIAGAGVGASMIGGQMIGGDLGSLVSGVGSGAAIGFGVGGPWGAAIGAGAGGLLTILPKLFSSTPKVSKLHREIEHLEAASKSYAGSLKGLVGAEKRVTTTTKHHNAAVRAQKAAARHLAATLARFGTESQPATKAQIKLDRATRRATRALQAQRRAHRLAGNALKVYRMESLHETASIKQSLPSMRKRVETLNKELNVQPHNIALAKETLSAERRLSKARRELTTTYAQAEAKAGKPWAKRLENLTTLQARYGSKGRTLVGLMDEQRRKMEQLKAMGLTAQYREEAAALGDLAGNLERIIEQENHVGGNLGKGPKAGGPHKKNTSGDGGNDNGGRTPVSYWLNSPDSRPSEATAGASSAGGGGGKTKTLQPIMLQVGRRTLASVLAEVQNDDKARL